ncbi:MAG: adenosylcobinamide-phosphate synthase CbiB [Pseudomonadota bacterium]
MIDIHWAVVLCAIVLDFIFGDPERLPHPVIYMGNAISFFESRFRKMIPNLLISGILFAVFLIVSTWLIAFITIKSAMAIHPVLGIVVQIFLLFFCFSSRSLERAALAVFNALKIKNLPDARQKVAMIVGRQTQKLDQKAITRATVETVAENYVDGFLSPLFFACIGGVPFALAYKMINTLDSMVGYKNETYLFFGRGAARIDDVANFIPARLSVLMISLAALVFSSKRAFMALKIGFYQGNLHKSPNAGYPEAAFAGALKIRLGGPSIYHGTRVDKPFLGKNFNDPEPIKIKQACDLMILSSLCATLMSCLFLGWV